ncbi:hypothetical protein D3C76_1452740 [compost metagenome]
MNAGDHFIVSTEFMNTGRSQATVTVELQTRNVNHVGSTTQVISLNAGASGTLSWPLIAGLADQPYVVLAILEGDQEAGKSMMGYVQ